MAQSQRHTPGPTGMSCLTCKQRHKKCDLRRPVCERCEAGGFECLGYTHNNQSPLVRAGSSRPRLILPKQDRTSSISDCRAISRSTRSEVGDLDCGTEAIPLPQESLISSTSLSLCSNDRLIDTTQHVDQANTCPTSEMPNTRNHRPHLAAHLPAKRIPGPTPSLRSLFKFYTQIPYVPYHLSKTLLDSANLEDYVMSFYTQTMERVYFKPVQAELALIQHSFASRLRISGFNRWMMFLNAKICDSYFKGDTSQNTTYDIWLRQVEQALRGTLSETLAPGETQNRQGYWLEVMLLRAVISQSSNTYQVLRNATPTFLQMLFSEPTLWPSSGDLTSIPLANVLTSQRHELACFALLDNAAAMAFGFPQQVEYDTSCPPNTPVLYERMHCCPIEFQITLAEINACRDKSSNARDWKEIERSLTTWQTRPSEYDANSESWMKVAWFAVQESWRHTLLAYLYMAVCGASSDDPRVQSSVRQILSVISTVKRQESADVPFFIQPLMAGICARSEKHRSLVRQQLVDTSYVTPQLMRAIDFVPVLDHLWHGVAAGGRPVAWSDYICSRETVLPVLT